jgi:hypothetical protein
MEYGDWAAEVLAELRWNWGRGYEIEHEASGVWSARRRDGRGDWLTAADPGALRKVMFRDYTLDPVPRDNVTICTELRADGNRVTLLVKRRMYRHGR